jgi:hypothetical protein
MAEAFIHKNLADKRKEIQAYIGSLERDLEKARKVKRVEKVGTASIWCLS